MKKIKVYSYLKYLILGIFLTLLFHFESLSLGPLKVSHLWKGVLLIYLLNKLLKSRNVNVFIYKPLVLLAIMQLINFDIVNSPKTAIISFGTILLLPLIGIYLLNFNSKKIEQYLLFIASVFIISFVPYKLGILTSIGEGYNLNGYGVDTIGLIGPFQKVHTASTTLAGSLIIILYFLINNTFNKLYLTLLFLLGFYFLFYTYVRTGMAMFAVGSIPILYYYGKKNLKSFSKVFIVGAISLFLISSWVLTNDTLMRRIAGDRDYYQEDSIETFGSGRVYFFINAFEIYTEENLYEKILGIGETEQLERMKSKIGVAIFPHNGFMFLLLVNGAIGLLLFLSFIKKVFKLQKKSSISQKSLLTGLFFAYLIMTFLQSYDMIYMFLLLALGIAYLKTTHRETQYNKL